MACAGDKLHTAPVPAAPPAQGMIFLSYAATDGRYAAQLSRLLESSGLKVTSSGSLTSPDVPWKDALEEAVKRSSTVVTLQFDTPSTTVEDALAAASGLQKPTYRVQVGEPPDNTADRLAAELTTTSPAFLYFAGHGAPPERVADKLVKALQPESGSTPTQK